MSGSQNEPETPGKPGNVENSPDLADGQMRLDFGN